MSADKKTIDVAKAIKSYPKEEVQSPYMPIHVAVQETEDLYKQASIDKKPLLNAGMDESVIEALLPAARELRNTESTRVALKNNLADAQKTWKEESEKAYTLRDELLAGFRYAYRNTPEVLNTVREIADGSSDSDMIQDLDNLKALGLQYKKELEAVKFDLSLLDTAGKTAERLGTLYASAKVESGQEEMATEMRDRAWTYLKTLVQDVRECGKYVFHNDSKKRRNYTSAYQRRMRHRYERKAAEKKTGEAVTV